MPTTPAARVHQGLELGIEGDGLDLFQAGGAVQEFDLALGLHEGPEHEQGG